MAIRVWPLFLLDRDQQKLKGDNSDEEMWVPSDLESDSEIEDEEEAGEKNEENEEDSGGEFSSEGALLNNIRVAILIMQTLESKMAGCCVERATIVF